MGSNINIFGLGNSKDRGVQAVIDSAKAATDAGNNPGISQEAASRIAVLALLNELGGARVQEDALKFEGSSFVLPQQYKGRLSEAAKFLMEHQKTQETEQDFPRTFDYLPYDVAHALQVTLKNMFGTTGSGAPIMTMFGPIAPEFVTVNVGVGQTVQVPWNKIDFPALEGSIVVGHNGARGYITVTAPRKYRSAVEGLFLAVEAELKRGSIYKGKAFVSGRWDMIEFLDTSKVKRAEVIYGDDTMSHLEANLWVPIRHTEALRAAGQPIKRTVLLEGPYGTGKSLAGYLTAQEAEAHGWTFIFVKPGSDLNAARKQAELYAPAVVFFEDIDVLQSNDPEAVSRLLDSFDGIGGKGKEVIGVLTTNHKDKIHKGMLRPGRVDSMISIAELDLGGVERLIKASVPDQKMLVNIDYPAIFAKVEKFQPAFVREVASRAFRYAMVREGKLPTALFTEDFTSAADSLVPQFDLMSGAKEHQPRQGVDAEIRNLMADVLEATQPKDGDDDNSYSVNKFEVNRNA